MDKPKELKCPCCHADNCCYKRAMSKVPKYNEPIIRKAIEDARYYYESDERNHVWAKHLLGIAEKVLEDFHKDKSGH